MTKGALPSNLNRATMFETYTRPATIIMSVKLTSTNQPENIRLCYLFSSKRAEQQKLQYSVK